MTTISMALYNLSFDTAKRWQPGGGHHAIWVQKGALDIAGQSVGAGEGVYIEGGQTTVQCGAAGVEALHFEVTIGSARKRPGVLLAVAFDFSDAGAVLRLDQVTFPPGARAWRHVHSGPGIRCLVEGQLEIQSDRHTEVMTPSDAWFENADSPVQATAGSQQTAFVRLMVLPVAYEGKPTLRYLSAEDENKPRHQINRRFFDQRLCLRNG